MEGPDSSYSCLEIHICWKVDREAKMEPPIHTEYFLSGGAMILIFMVLGARAVISFCILSAIPVEDSKGRVRTLQATVKHPIEVAAFTSCIRIQNKM